MTTPTQAPPGGDEARFGRPTAAVDERPRPVDYGPNHDEIIQLLGRAATLTPAQVRQLASAAAWQWVPLGLPAGSVASARSAAIAAGRAAGRGDALEAAQAAAREAALGSPGGREAAARWSWAENAVAALGLSVLGAVVSAFLGITILAAALVVVAVACGVALLFVESAYVRRLRLTSAVAAAALGITTRGLVDPGQSELLIGPWRTIVHD